MQVPRGVTLALLLAATLLASGCTGLRYGSAGVKRYFVDRGHDAADIFTLTAGAGVGAKVRVGPLHSGLGFFRDAWGLRGGHLGGMWKGTYDCVLPIPPLGGTTPIMESWGWFAIFVSCADFEQLVVPAPASERGKTFFAGNMLPLVLPVLGIAMNLRQADYLEESPRAYRERWYYYTQIEAVVGAGGSLRAGFNPGELADFVLGWFGIDIYDDDRGPRWAGE